MEADILFWISVAGNILMIADKIVAKTENKYDDIIVTGLKKILGLFTEKYN